MLASTTALLGVGAFEAAWGAYMLCCTGGASEAAVGRHYIVNASPTISPLLSYAGALRLGVAAMVLVAASTPDVSKELIHRLVVVVIAHTCVLQPFAAACRSVTRLPTGFWVCVTLAEGAGLVASLAADYDFSVDVLPQLPVFEAAVSCFLFGVLLSLWSAGAACCCTNGADRTSSDVAAPLFDEHRHQLSPASKRLLA